MDHCANQTPGRILIVEDAPEVRLLVRGVLESERYQVHAVETGAQALVCLSEQAIDLILLDIDLPDIQGTTLCRQLRSQGFKSPIVMLTCHNRGAERAEGLDCGADDYLGKPFLPEELLARIRAHLRREERHSESVEELLKQHWTRIDDGMRLAQRMQQPLSGHQPLPHIASAARHVPIGRIGGDFYILEQIDQDRSVVAIADTMGKGLGAALVMSWTLAAVHDLIRQGLDPGPLMNRLSRELGPDLERMGVFVALFCGLYDRRSGLFKYCSAGSEAPILIQGHSQVRVRGPRHCRLTTEGIPVGVMSDFDYEQAEICPGPGDQLFLFTDGLTDSVPVDRQALLIKGLYRVLLQSLQRPLSERADNLMQCLRRLAGHDLVLKDDLTFVLMEFPLGNSLLPAGSPSAHQRQR